MTHRLLAIRTLAAALLLGSAVHGFAQEAATTAERFVLQADGSVLDSQTGLAWAGKDNGGDVDWAGAASYCQTLGAGWRLPDRQELIGLYDPSQQQAQDCIGQLTCKLTSLIRVTGLTPWAAESAEAGEAWYVYLDNGQAYSFDARNTQGRRALCVRRP